MSERAPADPRQEQEREPATTDEFDEREILDAAGIESLLDQLADQIAGRYGQNSDLCLIGVRRRGDVLAERLRARLKTSLGQPLPIGSLDITLYRDDFDSLSQDPVVAETVIPFTLDGRTVILVDDVLFTGRTTRAALDELLDLGRPARIVLVALIDRGWRELPIAADIVGKTIATERDDDVQVLLAESDRRDSVTLRRA